jgi:hypothetical protein
VNGTIRRQNLLLQYNVKLKTNPDNPAFDCVFDQQLEDMYDKNKNTIKPIGLTSTPLQLQFGHCKTLTLSDIPPWQLLRPKVYTSLSEYKKSEPYRLQTKTK